MTAAPSTNNTLLRILGRQYLSFYILWRGLHFVALRTSGWLGGGRQRIAALRAMVEAAKDQTYVILNPASRPTDLRRWVSGIARGDNYRFVATGLARDRLGLPIDRTILLDDARIVPEADMAIHAAWQALTEHRRDHFASPDEAEAMRMLEVSYTGVEIALRRLDWTLDRLPAHDRAPIFVVPDEVDAASIVRLIEGRATRGAPAVAFPTSVESSPRRRDGVTLRACCAVLRHLQERRAARLIRRCHDTVQLIVVDTQPDTPYWHAAMALVDEGKRRGRHSLILTSFWQVVLRCRHRGVLHMILNVALLPCGDRRIVAARNQHFLDRARLLCGRFAGDPASASALGWLASSHRAIDLDAAWALRDFARRLVARLGKAKLFVMPHWGTLAELVGMEFQAYGGQVVSAPVVTVSDKPGSIIGWENIDTIAAYGRHCVDSFCSAGYRESHLPITGNIGFDKLVTASRDVAAARNRVEGLLRESLPSNVPLIAIVTSGIDRQEEKWVSVLADMSRDGHFVVIRKLHPSLVYAQPEIRGSILKTLNAGAVEDLLAIADVVLTDNSTAGAQAVLMSKSLVVVNFTAKPFPANDYAEAGVALLVSDIGMLESTILAALAGRKPEPSAQAAFIGDYNGPNDGHAARRVWDLLEDAP
jgi:hypothetical protein